MTKKHLDHIMEKCPSILITLTKKLITCLSPVVLNIDMALEWVHVNAGQILCKQNDHANSIYLVLSGRLRTILDATSHSSDQPIKPENFGVSLDGIGDSLFPSKQTIGTNLFEIINENGQGETVCELEVLTGARLQGTVHAIRDTEIAVLPKILFEALSIQYPKITIQISRILAAKTYFKRNNGKLEGLHNDPLFRQSKTAAILKTVCLFPVNSIVPLTEFADRLKESLSLLGSSVIILSTCNFKITIATVMNRMGKHAFTRLGRLKLMSWLNELEDKFRLVLYVADGGVASPWTQRCVKQADCIMVVGLGDDDPSIGDYERLLISMKTTARYLLLI